MPTPWPQPCPVTRKVALPAAAAFCVRAGAAGPVPSRKMETIATVRRIEVTPARTRTRLAKRLVCSGFLYGTLIWSFRRPCTGQTRGNVCGGEDGPASGPLSRPGADRARWDGRYLPRDRRGARPRRRDQDPGG